MLLNYHYEDMLMHARKMTRMLPSLIDANNWEAVLEVAIIHPYIWDGQAARAYNELVNNFVVSKDKSKIINLPNLIIEAAENMKRREETLANMARSILF